MTYLAVATMSRDRDIADRVAACASVEGDPQPEKFAAEHAWQIAASPGWAEKWDAALAGGIVNPGADSSVITDADILSAVQAIRSEQFVPPKDTKGA